MLKKISRFVSKISNFEKYHIFKIEKNLPHFRTKFQSYFLTILTFKIQFLSSVFTSRLLESKMLSLLFRKDNELHVASKAG